MSQPLDWSKENWKNLRFRNGSPLEIERVHVMPEWASGSYPVRVKIGNEIKMYTLDGHWMVGEALPRDIVQAPPEPLEIVVYINQCVLKALAGDLEGRSCSILKHPGPGRVKVKITELIEGEGA